MILTLLDTTVLSNFAHIGQSALLVQAYDRAAVVEAVIAEFALGVMLGRLPQTNWDALERVDLTPAEGESAALFMAAIGAGEAACIAVCQARGAALATDDSEARAFAKNLGIRLTGTIGALVALMARGVITLEQAEGYHEGMRLKGFRSPLRSLRDLPNRP